MTHHSTVRSRIALAERDRSDINITRVREVLEAQAGRMIEEWSRNPRKPVSEIDQILEEGRQLDLAAEAAHEAAGRRFVRRAAIAA